MLRKSRESWKELWAIQKESFKWIRKHWKGYSVVLVIAFFLPWIVTKTVDYISERRYRKNIKVNKDIEP